MATPRTVTKKERELALKWVQDEITLYELGKRINKSATTTYIMCALALKAIIKDHAKN